MTIHLREATDGRGDLVELYWYCSRACYQDSFARPYSVQLTTGGAYPCGEESDSPDFCAQCGEPVGNPLTTDGLEYLRELIARADTEHAEALASEYRWDLEDGQGTDPEDD